LGQPLKPRGSFQVLRNAKMRIYFTKSGKCKKCRKIQKNSEKYRKIQSIQKNSENSESIAASFL
jgi:hypothetical protein